MGSRTGENRPANYRDLTDAKDAVDLLRDDYQALHARCVRAEEALRRLYKMATRETLTDEKMEELLAGVDKPA